MVWSIALLAVLIGLDQALKYWTVTHLALGESAELIPGFLDGISGTYKDPEGYFVCEKNPEAFEKFEAAFPKKEKLKLPGQLF